MKTPRFVIISIVAFTLSGCSTGEAKSASLMKACQSIDQYRNTNDIQTRLQLLYETAFHFRKEAYSSNEVKYEVLAEYASMESDRLGNISPYALGEISIFCQKFN